MQMAELWMHKLQGCRLHAQPFQSVCSIRWPLGLLIPASAAPKLCPFGLSGLSFHLHNVCSKPTKSCWLRSFPLCKSTPSTGCIPLHRCSRKLWTGWLSSPRMLQSWQRCCQRRCPSWGSTPRSPGCQGSAGRPPPSSPWSCCMPT